MGFPTLISAAADDDDDRPPPTRIDLRAPLNPRLALVFGRIATMSTVDVDGEGGSFRTYQKLGIQHTPNFRVVKWGKETFSFTATQARVVAALVTAHRRGIEWLDQETLIAQAECGGDRIYSIFKRHPAWNRWIVSATPVSEAPATWMLALAV